MKLLEILLLVLPITAWALWNDRNGDEHKTSNDIFWECVFVIWMPILIRVFQVIVLQYPDAKSLPEWLSIYLPMYAVSITGFGLIFPYAFNWMWFNKTMKYSSIMYKCKISRLRVNYILTHLSQTAMPDKWFIKYNVHYLVRLSLYVTLFGLSVYWFI